MSRNLKSTSNRLLCLWRKPDHLSINVVVDMESEVESAQKAIEVSHGSAGEFSKSAASHMYISNKRSKVFGLVSCLIFALILAVLLPLFWFGSVPTISVFMQKGNKYRLPVTIAAELLMLAIISTCIVRLAITTRSLNRRSSYISSCLSEEFRSVSTQNFEQSTSPLRSARSTKSGSLRSKRNSDSLPNMNIVALRQILESLPTETVARIQELGKRFLNSGNGRSTIEPGKFSTQHKISMDSNSSTTYKIAVKVLLVGDINVGKTSIFHRILYDQFSSSYLQTIGADLGFSTLILSTNSGVDSVSVGLQIWDLGGQEQLVKATKHYYKDAVVVIPVADISNLASLAALHNWLHDISHKVYDPYLVLLLNKADLDHKEVTEEEINKITELQNVERFEVSAKTGENVYKAFTESIAKVIIKETAKML